MQNQANAVAHLKTHQTYPATKAQLVAECDNLSDFTPEDKKEFMDKLPEGSYATTQDAMKALGMSVQPAGGQQPPPTM